MTMKQSPMIAKLDNSDRAASCRRVMAAERDYYKNTIMQLQADNRRLRAIGKTQNEELQKIVKALAVIQDCINSPANYYKLKLLQTKNKLKTMKP